MSQILDDIMISPVLQRLNIRPIQIAEFCKQYHVMELGIFGSVLRDDFGPESDVDFLVMFEPGHSLSWGEWGRAVDDLTALVGRSVDLTRKNGVVNPFSRSEILKTVRVIYPFQSSDVLEIVKVDRMTQENVRNNAALLDMVEAIEGALRFSQGSTFEDYECNELLRRAMERQLEILGEAANRVSNEFQQLHLEIDWRNVVGLRNRIIHEYDRVDDATIWRIVVDVLPPLLEQVMTLVPPLPEVGY